MSISDLDLQAEIAAQINMMEDDITEQQNFIEAKIIIQEFNDDSSVFIVGSAPFGKLWFDQERVDKQFELLCENWAEDYDETTNIRSKKPRIISVLISEHDSMFEDFKETIRETQARKNLIHELAMQMKIAEAVKAAMVAAGIPYPIEYPVHVEAPAAAAAAPRVQVDVGAPVVQMNVGVNPDATKTNVVVKEKKPRAKKSAPTDSGENVVLEKKPSKPRQKKSVATPAAQV
jgi:hypothetical protein